MPSVLIISFVEWGGAFQRPHHLAVGLARRGWRVDYACPGYLHRRAGRVSSGLDLPAGLRVIEPAALPGGSRLAMVAALNERWMKARLRRQASPAAARAAGITGADWDAIIFNDPRWAAVAQSLPAKIRIFDCMDDLSATAPSSAWAARMERAALTIADRVWTGTWSLADHLSGRHPQVRFIACGVEGQRFAEVEPAALAAVRTELPPGEGPLAGYFGVLNERIDGVRLEAFLNSAPWRVLFIGPATSRAPRLPPHPRLRWIGPRPYAQLPALLAHFDLALIPYHTSGPSRYLYPVKALEYLAGGKPVLSSPLPDVVRFLNEYVELADTPGDWQAAGARLYANRSAAIAKARRGQSYALGRSWEAMLDEMEAELRSGLEP